MPDTINTALQPVWKTRLFVDVTPSAGTPSYAPLCAGIENMEEAINEQSKQYYFMDGEGFAHNEVNAMAPTFSLQGRRVHGDAAQDFIEGLKYAPAEARKTSIQLISTQTIGSTDKMLTITCPATITSISTFGGTARDNSPFHVTFSLNGKPTVTRT